MEGLLLYYSSTEYWGNKTVYQLINSNEDTSFRKSYLKRPDKRSIHGDKAVVHRKMEGSVSPYCTNLAYAWTDFGIKVSRVDSTDDMWAVWTWQSGMNFCQNVSFSVRVKRSTGNYYSSNPEAYLLQFRVEIVNKEPHMFWYRYMFKLKALGYKKPSDLYNLTFPDPSRCTLYERWDVGYFRNNRWYWTSQPGKYLKSRNVSFQVSHPLPYYWIDYMNDIRPRIEPTMLSEVIRNTITDKTTLATNNISNAFEVVKLINDFRKGKIIELVDNTKDYFKLVSDTVGNISGKNLRTLFMNSAKGVSDGWLKYRYLYSTTKSDVEQYTEARLGEYLGRLSSERVLRNSISDNFTKVQIKMRLYDNPSANLDYVMIGLNQHGLMPSLYNIWDMLPFSFIADWGSNLGDYLQDIDESLLYWKYYQIDELLVSYKTVRNVKESWGQTSYTWYDRFFLDEFPQWEIYDQKETAAKVKCYRFLDAVSLIVGVL